MKRKNEWYECNKEKILSMYYCKKSIENICCQLKCNKSMIYRKFKEWGINRRERIKTSERCNAIYKIDYHYFDNIDCEHKAYWLGFLLADGFVNGKILSFCLKHEDRYMIENLKNDLNSEHPIKINKDGNPFITITCKHICNKLISYGFNNRKSWNLDIEKVVENIPKNLENHFIRGMFDGDGSIRYYKYDYLKTPLLHFGYTGLKNVCVYIKDKLNLDRKLIYEGNVTYTLVTRNYKMINAIFEYLYKNSTIYLDRKYKTFKEIQMMTFNDYNKAIS